MAVAAVLHSVFVAVLRDAARHDGGSADLLLHLDEPLLRLTPPAAAMIG